MDRRAGGWVIGRVAGARIVLRPSVALIVVVVIVLIGPMVRRSRPDLGTLAFAVAAAFAVLLLLSVLLHELAHAGMARRFGIQVHEVTLTLVGGHTELGQARTPGSSALVAVVGPLTNAAIAAAAWLALAPAHPDGVVALLLVVTASANGFVAAINLLPGLPLDGGRLLEAAVWRWTGRRDRGTVVAAWGGRVIAVCLVVAAIAAPYARGGRPDLITVAWMALLGALLWSGAGPFLRAAAHSRAVEGLVLREVAVRAPVLPRTATIAELDACGSATAVLTDDDGAPVAYVDPVAAAEVPPAQRAATPVAAVAVTLPPGAAVAGDLTGTAAVRAVVDAARVSPVLVVLDRGGVYGLLRHQDVVTALRRGS